MAIKATDQRLLILACSRKKKANSKLLPAVDCYDGPAFQVLRKFLVECPAKASKLDIWIISAKFGLVPDDQPASDKMPFEISRRSTNANDPRFSDSAVVRRKLLARCLQT